VFKVLVQLVLMLLNFLKKQVVFW